VSRGVLLCALETSCSRLCLRGTWTSRLWDCLRSTGWRARMRSYEIMKDGAADRPGTVSVWEALVRSQQSGLLQGYPTDPATERATSRGSLFHLSLPGRVPERVSEKPGYMQIRTPSPSLVFPPFLATAISFCLLSSRLSPTRISQRYLVVRAMSRKGAFFLTTYVHTRAHTHTHVYKELVLHFVRYPPAFILRESILRVAPCLL